MLSIDREVAVTAYKFYFKNTATGVPAGTYPDLSSPISQYPGIRIPGAASNLFMDPVSAGASAVGINFSTLANTSAQPTRFNARWISPALAATTINSMPINSGFSASESSASSNFYVAFAACFWRPSIGAMVAMVADINGSPAGTGSGAEVGTSQGWQSGTQTILNGPITIQNGDVLIVEAYRDLTAQAMGTAYTNTFWYNGASEVSGTDPASFFQLANGVELYTGPPPASAGDFWGIGD